MHVMRLDDDTFDWDRGAGGAATVRAIADAAAAYDGREALNEAARLRLSNDGLSTGMMLLAEDGFAYVHGLSGSSRPEIDLVVTPHRRGRGIGTVLARTALDLLDGIPLTAWSHGNHPAALALAGRLGLAPVRELWLMRRPTAAVPFVPGPEGVTVRTFQVGRDEDAFLKVNADAFASHPEQGALDRTGLSHRMAEDWFDAGGFFLAERDGDLVGFHWTKVHPASAAGPAYGEVYVIGVSPRAQGIGLGKVLLTAGLHHLVQQGLEETVLYVEADNEAAIRMYRDLGFTHAEHDTDVMYAGR